MLYPSNRVGHGMIADELLRFLGERGLLRRQAPPD
jgi:hypothetical protein